MKIKERALSILLSLVMVLTFMPALAFADDCEHTDLEFIPAYEATCVEEGMEAHWQCMECGKYFKDSEEGADYTMSYDNEVAFVIEKDENNHPDGLVYYEGYDAWCDYEGELAHYYCPYCENTYEDAEGTVKLESVVIQKLGHEIVPVEGWEPSLLEDGQMDHWECLRCEESFSDEAGTQIATWEDLRIPKTAPNPDVLDGIMSSDYDAWEKAINVFDAADSAERYLNAGNVAAAVSTANAAVSGAQAAQGAANAVLTKAKQYISDNEGDLTEEEKAEILSYFQETVDYANRAATAAATISTKANTAAAVAAEAVRQGTPGSLPKIKASKPKASKKAITVKWKKLSKKQLKSGVTNIEIWVSADGSFAKGPTIEKFASKKKSSLKIKGLAKGTYHVWVRSVILNPDGTKIVGTWSKKTVKVKK